MRECLRCGLELIQDPVHPHWRHCPSCDPVWANFCRDWNRRAYLEQLVAFAVTDTRGRPTIGGSRR